MAQRTPTSRVIKYTYIITGATDASRSKHNQAVPHTDVVSSDAGSDADTAKNSVEEYVKLPHEVRLSTGGKMTFYARKENAPTFDEIMDEINELASEALVRKLSK